MMSKWRRRFLPLIIALCAVLIIIQVSLYLLAYIELFTLFGGVLLPLLAIPISYAIWYVQTKYQQTKTVQLMNKMAFILAGAFLAPAITLFGSAFIALATGWVATNYIGGWGTIIIMYVVAPIIGASITYWIGKRRDYRPFM
jgi:predicted RND superfamily exporter protein